MKNLILILSVLVLVFGSLTIGYCYYNEVDDEYTFTSPPMQFDRDEISFADSPINKLERGIINMATFWMEIPAEVAKVSNEHDLAAGATVGVVNGVIISAIRGATAIYDTATFSVPSYTKPIMKPEYAWKVADDKIRAWLW
jgi:putative exosortase-associated protein (TIGR04073 family)